jgi:hypothetical protein
MSAVRVRWIAPTWHVAGDVLGLYVYGFHAGKNAQYIQVGLIVLSLFAEDLNFSTTIEDKLMVVGN